MCDASQEKSKALVNYSLVEQSPKILFPAEIKFDGYINSAFMSKLFKLKEWLSVADAAKHLTIVFDEEVTEADVLRLALDGHLKLSVNFVNHAKAKPGRIVSWEETEWFRCPPIIRTPLTNQEREKASEKMALYEF
jgi:hypothetical protein